jgi:hypothetical protein
VIEHLRRKCEALNSNLSTAIPSPPHTHTKEMVVSPRLALNSWTQMIVFASQIAGTSGVHHHALQDHSS